ncbi:MAG: nucleotidyltransferase domain-containing protein, partial [Candidatus Micrarchaeota archaeon]|nr:nucleotidyltransferase domain-containing protein [Candidatus Micrarchaeota archaeon]
MKNQGVIRKLIRILVKKYSPEKVIIFGSHAWGKPSRDSDIDIFIVKETRKKLSERFVEVQKLLHGFHSSIPVEPLVLTPREVEKRVELRDPFILKIL